MDNEIFGNAASGNRSRPEQPAAGRGGGGPEASGDPALFRTYIVPPDASVDQLVEIAIEAHADSDGWAGQIRDESRHYVIIYNATAAQIQGIQFVFRNYPDHIGPIAQPQPETERPSPVEPQRRGRVTARALNVRAEPRVVPRTLLATLQHDDLVVILADENPYWYRIEWDAPGQGHAFVSKAHIEEI